MGQGNGPAPTAWKNPRGNTVSLSAHDAHGLVRVGLVVVWGVCVLYVWVDLVVCIKKM